MDKILFFLNNDLLPMGFWGVFFASLIEEIVAPIPSAVVMIGAGFLLVKGSFWVVVLKSIFLVALPSAIGVTLGAFLVYYLSLKLEDKFVTKFGKYFFISQDMIQKASIKISEGRRDDITLLILRIFPLVPNVVVNVLCGIFHIPVKTFLTYTFLGVFIRAFFLGLVGWYLSDAYHKYVEFASDAKAIVFALLGILFTVYLAYRRFRL